MNTQAFEWDHLHDGNPYLFRYEHNMRLWDEHEMHWDMCKWEDEEAQHELFSNNPFEERILLDQKDDGVPVNKRSECIVPVKITKNGNDYLTGKHILGKVYIPKHVWIGDFLGDLSDDNCIIANMRIRFLGFEGCRPFRTMPWRAMEMFRD